MNQPMKTKEHFSHHSTPGSASFYGDTIVESGAVAHLGDVVYKLEVGGGEHHHPAEIQALLDLLGHLQARSSDPRKYVNIFDDLAELSATFHKVEQVEAYADMEESQHVHGLRAMAHSTSMTLKDFGSRLQSLTGSGKDVEQEVAKGDLSLPQISRAVVKHELGWLHQYLTCQMLSININLLLLNR